MCIRDRPLPAARAPVPLREIEQVRYRRVLTGIPELDRVLGGGVVPGSAVLVGGDPGIGKSTLLLQMCSTLQLDGGAIPVSYTHLDVYKRQVWRWLCNLAAGVT